MVLPDNKGGLFREVREHGDNLVTALDITEVLQGRPAAWGGGRIHIQRAVSSEFA